MKIRKKCPICDTWYTINSDQKKHLKLIQEDFPDTEDFWLGSWCPKAPQHYKMQLRKKVAALPKDTRQKVLDLIWEGKTIGEVKDQLKLETDVVAQIISDNIKCYKYLGREVE